MNEDQRPRPEGGRDGYESHSSPYGSWPGAESPQSPQSPQGDGAGTTSPYPGNPQNQPPQNQQPVFQQSPSSDNPNQKRGPRKVGLGAALALMLVGAVAAGSIVGVVATQFGPGSSFAQQESATEALRQEANDIPEPADGSVAHVAEEVLPAVVSIQAISRIGAGEGSGSIISPDGLVLTNHHVVADARDGGLQVTLNNGERHPAEYVASDPNTDIGIIQIQGVSGLPTLEFGDSDQLVVGQEVVAIGAPLGLSGTVTSGIVSALERPVRAVQGGGESSLIDAIQTDAAINPGNSGGPLVDMNGNLVGINSVIASLSTGDTAGSIGLGFAIPSNFAQRVSQQLVEDGEATQPMLGVSVDARDPIEGGALVASVQGGSPADEAGIREGEVITRVNDRVIDTADSLITAVRSHDFGETVTLEVLDPQTEDTREVEVTLTDE
ncbi:serine protease [Corynebacterium yudongzhengii]|uniref:PDZ domain-containing protein n=1 Tax=Corynebacterium yudongzhengii TaxID=2080740 RepID=A0A2U1T7U4_9CORY|nr:trypsin-like peptidase domain-containing protein [Corynebacterium yudongzhengii]AWB82307.1 serine protease [Corynebacterium yudongzhengii]PWC02074.1 PDZ domain-containing protein [Corynebacterium yudongzhengii]